MPKILIKEIDNTSVNNATGTNFSVVVPGFCGKTVLTVVPAEADAFPCLVKESDDCIYYYTSATKKVLIFDENGIYECNDIDKFKTYVGIVETEASAVAAVPATGPAKFNEAEFTSAKSEGNLYYANVNSEKIVGYLKFAVGDGEDKVYYTATKVASTDTYVSGAMYCQIQPANLGTDAQSIAGNQIAYELIKFGYTVLFKRIASAVTELDSYDNFWACLEDKSVYDFRYVMTGLLNNCATANKNIIKLANLVKTGTNYAGRGDCIALVDVDPSHYDDLSGAFTDLKSNDDIGKNVALLAPWVEYSFTEANYTNRRFPAGFHYLMCSACALRNYPEWFAVAGYNRGVGDYAIENVGHKYGDADVQLCQARKASTEYPYAINLIAKVRGNYYIWGNRTAAALPEDDLKASHFLNIRQLCCTLEKEIYDTCKSLTYDPNSDILWLNFCNAIRPTLESMKANQGIKAYAFEKKTTSMKAKLFACIRIVPIEAVEDFEIGVSLEDNLDEPSVKIIEELK